MFKFLSNLLFFVFFVYFNILLKIGFLLVLYSLNITDIVAKANNKITIKTGKTTVQKTNIKYNDGIPKIL